MTEPLYLVDASIYIFRAYFSIPDTFVDGRGESVNAVYGYTNFMLDLLEKQPQYISFAFDESLNTCYRNDIYPEYKANRDLPDENLEFQLAKCQEITRLLGMHHLSLKRYEADDIIGTLHTMLAADRPAIIVTRDKDLGQLLRANDLLWDFAADLHTGPVEVKEKFGVHPHQIADYLALAGDSVDNIPGAPGIGAKSAAKILAHFGDIDSLYRSIDEIEDIGLRGASRAKQTLLECEDRVRMFQEITRIKCDIEVDVSLEDLEPSPASANELESFCDEMNFGKRVRERLAAIAQASPSQPS
jgi:DNA polymerase-1